MIEIANDALELRCRPDGTQVVIRDKQRGTGWRLDEETRRYRLDGEETSRLLGTGTAVAVGKECIRQEFDAGGAGRAVRAAGPGVNCSRAEMEKGPVNSPETGFGY